MTNQIMGAWLTIKTTTDMGERLEAAARERDMSMSAVIRTMLKDNAEPYKDRKAPEKVETDPLKKTVVLKLPADLKQAAQHAAEVEGVPLNNLLNEWLDIEV